MIPKFREYIEKYANLTYFDEGAEEIAKKIDERIIPLYKEVLDLFFESDKRYLILFGGRSSGKTDSVSSYLFKRLAVDQFKSVILRSAQTSIKDTNVETIINILEDLEISHRFKHTKNPFTFMYKTGKLTLLGVKREDIAQNKIKSFANTHVFVFEEADLFKESTFNTSNLSLRGFDTGKTIMLLNPPREGVEHWIYKRFFPKDYKDNHDKLIVHYNAMILHTSYMDCPHNPKGLIDAMIDMKRTDPYEYDRIVLGNFTYEKQMRVYPKYKVVKRDYIYDDSICTFGIDWGFRDTMAIVQIWYSVEKNVLYIANEYGREGLDPDEVVDFIMEIPGITTYRSYADNSSPAMIKLLKKYIPIRPVKKLVNSILNGVFRIRSMNIKVNETCKETIKELGLYEWKVHPDDEKLANTSINPRDMHNHYMDAMRYALDKQILRGVSLIDVLKNGIG